ncbi:hypothetical protein HOD08_03230 [bacterium]|jgi:Co/Zn/Cd efflux system component|nr:hypothetical protein [bacterium]
MYQILVSLAIGMIAGLVYSYLFHDHKETTSTPDTRPPMQIAIEKTISQVGAIIAFAFLIQKTYLQIIPMIVGFILALHNFSTARRIRCDNPHGRP